MNKASERSIEEFERFFRIGRAQNARRLVTMSIRMGRLRRGPCVVCENSVTEAHHRDYDKPLDVTWVCRDHHWFVAAIERMVEECGNLLWVAVDSGYLWALTDTFAQELTKFSPRKSQGRRFYPIDLRANVEKYLSLLATTEFEFKSHKSRAPKDVDIRPRGSDQFPSCAP